MRIRKDHTSITDVYQVEDGPVAETQPGYLSQGQFRVDYLAVTRINDEVLKIYIRGKHIKADGQYGKTTRARTYFGDFPHWVTDFLES